MNYRHAYHAGNFADVLKHSVLALVIEHLKLKPAPFRVIDTHAGIGVYDLAAETAEKTGEWRQGIGRLIGRDLPPGIDKLLSPYLDVVRELNPVPERVERYPGSPMIARRLMRRGDQLVVNELHPEDHATLQALFVGDPQTKVLALDGWTAVKSLLPPKERRGVVLIDPPFEDAGELQRLTAALEAAHQRFATGTVILWYPIKSPAALAPYYAALRNLGLPKLLRAELFVRGPANVETLNGTGLVIFNPPYTLPANLSVLLPFLATSLAQGAAGSSQVSWLSPPVLNST